VTQTPKKQVLGYLHGYSTEEEGRLYRQARFLEHLVHVGLPFHRSRRLLEVGCGVGAQTEILLRLFPELHITGLDSSAQTLEHAREHLAKVPWAGGRFDGVVSDAGRMTFEPGSFDSAFLCWILEHVADPALVLSEVRRVLRPGSPVVVTEVQNATFFLDPYSPNTLAYWTSSNDHQLSLGGDPFVGARLGNLLLRLGYRDITTKVQTIHLDNRAPVERAEMLEYWTELLLSGAPGLLESGNVSTEIVEGMKRELGDIAHNPDAVFFYAFVQARARVGEFPTQRL